MNDLDLIGSSDLADMLGVTRATVSNWKHRDPTFPKPVATISNGKIDVYHADDVRAWLRVKHHALLQFLDGETFAATHSEHGEATDGK